MKYRSLNVKIAIISVSLGFFLLTLLFVLIVPKMEKEQKEHTIKQIENMITLTTSQLKLATKAISKSGEDKNSYVKSIIESKVETIHHKLENISPNDRNEYLKAASKELSCDLYLINKSKRTLFNTSDDPLDTTNLPYNHWEIIKDDKPTVCPTPPKQLIYTKESHNKEDLLVLKCDPKVLNNNNTIKFEYKLKKDIQNSFFLTHDIHKGKIYLMWIDSHKIKNKNKPLYEKGDDHYFNNKYCLSKISNLRFPKTGLLSAKEIIAAIDKEPIEHLLDTYKDEGNYIYPALTWVRSINGDDNRKLLFITTVFEKDLHSTMDSSFWKILPASLLALLAAITAGFFIFRRLFKTVNILADTAQRVNEGDMKVRSNIKGEDDIGILGSTFDNMLDSVDKNIKELDKKVEQRTKELQSSLDEKETLLKEIHHRVKNNLAMTIELIKIQRSKLKDDATKEVLSDIQERVFTMELLHRKLYESKDLHSIDFKKYVTELSNDLYHSYESGKDIKIDIQMENINMDIEYALPCGLIINECLTNSFKYAFRDQKHGDIFILLKKEGSRYKLKVGDTGSGIPENIDINRPKSLGLKLISTIVKNQLLGKMEYSKKYGSFFIIVFNIDQGVD